jgi:hypothetical protein
MLFILTAPRQKSLNGHLKMTNVTTSAPVEARPFDNGSNPSRFWRKSRQFSIERVNTPPRGFFIIFHNGGREIAEYRAPPY